MMQLLACGSNGKGQLATGDAVDKHTFTPCLFKSLPTITSIISAVFGANHTVLLCENANVKPPVRYIFGAGDGSRGQLGTGITTVRRFRELELRDRASGRNYANEGVIAHIGACWATTYIVFRPDPVKLSSSSQSDVFISIGANNFSELGAPPSAVTVLSFANAINASGLVAPSSTPSIYRVVRLATGLHHIIVVLHIPLIDGSIREIIVGWGTSRNGQLELHENEEVDVASSASQISNNKPTRRSNGTAAYTNTPTHLYTVPEGEKVLSMALGQQHSVILIQTKEGSTKMLRGGSNRKGQLSFSSEIANMPLRSVHCTWNGTYFETSSGTAGAGDEGSFSILGTGSSEMGQLGRGVARTTTPPLPESSATPSPAIPIITPTPASLQASDHQVLFPPATKEARLGSLACGSEHVVAMLGYKPEDSVRAEDAVEWEAWAWGWNEHGNLGLGHVKDVSIPTRIWPSPISTKTTPSHFVEGELREVWAGNGTTLLLID